MKKRLLLVAALCTLGVLSINNHATDQVVKAAEDSVKMVRPDEIDAGVPTWHDDGRLEYRWEYLTKSYPDDSQGRTIKNIAKLEFKFYLSNETFDATKEYATVIHTGEAIMSSSEITTALKDANYPEESTVKVAIRYVANEDSGYLNSDYYTPDISHKYTIEYMDSTLWNIYLFGPATTHDWSYLPETRLVLDEKTDIYTVEYNIGGTGLLKMYALDATNEDFGARKEFTVEWNIAKKGLYRVQFSFKNQNGFEVIKNSDKDLNGYGKLEYLSQMDVLTEGTDLLKDKDVYSNEMPSNPKAYTDGTGNGFQMKPIDNDAGGVEHSFYLFDLGEVDLITSFKVRWEAACASEYDIFVSTEYIEDLSSFTYMEQPTSEWNLVKKQTHSGTGDDVIGCSVLARYVLIQTNVASSLAKQWGYKLYEVNAYSPSDTFIYGAQLGESEDGNAIRFIGLTKVNDVYTYSDSVTFSLTYAKDGLVLGPREVEINHFYKTLTTTLNGVTNVTMSAPNGYYFFSFTLTGVLEGNYDLTLKVNDEELQTVKYVYADGALARI